MTGNGELKMQILTGTQIPVARMITLKHALKLEILGMTRKGRSVYSIIKQEYGLTGNKKSVLEQFTAIVEAAKAKIISSI